MLLLSPLVRLKEWVDRKEKQEQEENGVSLMDLPLVQMCLSLPALPLSTVSSRKWLVLTASGVKRKNRTVTTRTTGRQDQIVYLCVSCSWEIRRAGQHVMLLHSWNLKKKIQITKCSACEAHRRYWKAMYRLREKGWHGKRKQSVCLRACSLCLWSALHTHLGPGCMGSLERISRKTDV